LLITTKSRFAHRNCRLPKRYANRYPVLRGRINARNLPKRNRKYIL
jgi:hypothetical protein